MSGHGIRLGICGSGFDPQQLEATFDPELPKTTNIPNPIVPLMIKFARVTLKDF